MDVDRLYGAFLAIARTGALSRAARQLGCSAAAISRQLDTLESHFGVRLFDRTTRSVRLSEAGHRLFPKAEAVLQALEDARHSVDAQRVQASVRVCAPIALGVEWVSRCLASLSRVQPGLQIDLVLENRNSDALAEGIDILVRSGLRMPEEPDLVVRDIGSLELGIYAGNRVAKTISRKASPQEIALLPWIGHRGFAFDQGLVLRQGDNEVLLRVQPWLWSSDILAIARMTEQGDSCAILPHWLARPSVAQGTLKAVLSDWRLPAAQIWLAWRNRGSNRESVARVAHHLREQLTALAQG